MTACGEDPSKSRNSVVPREMPAWVLLVASEKATLDWVIGMLMIMKERALGTLHTLWQRSGEQFRVEGPPAQQATASSPHRYFLQGVGNGPYASAGYDRMCTP
jgi:hypothetical protein